MGYKKISNLYKDIRILDFKECYTLEKIHGTSAHIKFTDGKIHFFSGGSKHETFIKLFDEEVLIALFTALGFPSICVYGEAYGGKMQGMSGTYGKELRFTAFEVQIGEAWLNVPNALDVATKLQLDFVPFEQGPATVEWLNEQRDKPSQIAKRLGIVEDKMREGIVIRPLKEYFDYRGNRIITKHKRDEFKETKTPRDINPEQLQILEEANDVADEWVTPMRLDHILDKLPEKGEMKHVPHVIRAMIADIKLESENEVIWSKAIEKAIGKNTVKLYKSHISEV